MIQTKSRKISLKGQDKSIVEVKKTIRDIGRGVV